MTVVFSPRNGSRVSGGGSTRHSLLSHINVDPNSLARSRWKQGLLQTGASGSSTARALIFRKRIERVAQLRHQCTSSLDSPQLGTLALDDSVSDATDPGGSGQDGAKRDDGKAIEHCGGETVEQCCGEAVEQCGGDDGSTTVPPLLFASHPLPLTALSEVQVASLLNAIGLGKYAAACQAVPLRGRDLQHCSAADLEALGISFQPHRLSLLEEVAKLAVEGVPASLLSLAAHVTPCGRDDYDDGIGIASSMPAWLHEAQVQLEATRPAGSPSAALPSPSEASPPPLYNPTLTSGLPQPPLLPDHAPGARSQRAPANFPAKSDFDTIIGALTDLSLKS